MARRVTKPTRKSKAAPTKKAAKAASPKKSEAKKKSAAKKAAKASKGAAPKKAAPKKKAKKVATKKAAPKKKVVKKASKPSKKAVKAPAKKAQKAARPTKKAAPPAKAQKPKAQPAPKRSAKKASAPRPKPSPAEVEALRIAKERREALDRQSDYYDKAIKAFNARRFQRALTLFEKAADGPEPTFGDRARVHMEICRRQTETRKVKLKTADELYNYGIQLINERRFQEAGRNIAQALKKQPRAAHIHFAAAVVAALTKDTESTYKSLKKAIELDPRNRVLALNDSDLASVTNEPAIAQLLHGDR